MLKRNCPSCLGELTIWHATIYETYNPEELTEEKLDELENWVEEVVKPGLAKILGEESSEPAVPNTCPHCKAELIYVNNPIREVKLNHAEEEEPDWLKQWNEAKNRGQCKDTCELACQYGCQVSNKLAEE